MNLLKWLHRHAAWLNLAACVAALLWAGWAWSVVHGLPGSAAAPMQLQLLRACPCQDAGGNQRTAMRI
ncbi:hypothetical protein [Paraburkholderia oxyphila]|uniref:hypothetical protein n=1 Tax=Paraburkholderia oxyphila TaxID=614212 RepID=UPI0004869F51|nr:hypothetical protein [Paraburkholderia oxyphila]